MRDGINRSPDNHPRWCAANHPSGSAHGAELGSVSSNGVYVEAALVGSDDAARFRIAVESSDMRHRVEITPDVAELLGEVIRTLDCHALKRLGRALGIGTAKLQISATPDAPTDDDARQVDTPHGALVHADSLLPYWPDDSTFSISLMRHRSTGQPWLEIEWEGHDGDEVIHVPLNVPPTVANFEDLPALGYATPDVGREVSAA